MTAFLQGFTIRTRMLGAIAMVLALIVLLGAAGFFGMQRIGVIGDDFADRIHADTVTLASLRTDTGNVRRFEKDLLINYDSRAEQTITGRSGPLPSRAHASTPPHWPRPAIRRSRPRPSSSAPCCGTTSTPPRPC